ncbi:unnamed protein product [Paramecium octaurelia]|uniref:Uncharacterized protein n=1 Tax=Paramecium octaurelia TaxID=43137 RepID=A0A8S1YKF2_PAROT|nr:unnamed protein product [Paramecium octaurelia]
MIQEIGQCANLEVVGTLNQVSSTACLSQQFRQELMFRPLTMYLKCMLPINLSKVQQQWLFAQYDPLMQSIKQQTVSEEVQHNQMPFEHSRSKFKVQYRAINNLHMISSQMKGQNIKICKRIALLQALKIIFDQHFYKRSRS